MQTALFQLFLRIFFPGSNQDVFFTNNTQLLYNMGGLVLTHLTLNPSYIFPALMMKCLKFITGGQCLWDRPH